MSPEYFDTSFYPALASVEDSHFWFVARNELIRHVVAGLEGDLGPFPMVLEVGCGTGGILRALEKEFPQFRLVGVDAAGDGLTYARERSRAHLAVAEAECLPFNSGFDLVCLLDVLEHLEGDRAALRDVARILRPGGKVLITVPASPAAWSGVDVVAGHRRRYTRESFEEVIRSAGFELMRSTYFMATLYIPLVLSRRIRSFLLRRTHRDEILRELRPHRSVNSVALWLLSRENARLAKGRTFPFGTSLMALAARPLGPSERPEA